MERLPFWLALGLSVVVSVMTSLYFGAVWLEFVMRVLVNFALYYVLILVLRWLWRKTLSIMASRREM